MRPTSPALAHKKPDPEVSDSVRFAFRNSFILPDVLRGDQEKL
jgi:hypothetical protein